MCDSYRFPKTDFKMKELYLFKSFDELTREAHINFNQYKRANLYSAAEKAFLSGLHYVDIGDEEKAYTLFHRFNLIYVHLETTDPCFMKQRLIREFNTASGLLLNLRVSLQKRYKQQNGKACDSRAPLIIETPAPSAKKEDKITFPSGFITCRDLYKLLTKKLDILIFDTRSQNDFAASKIKYSACVNIPEECIESGLSANILGKRIPKESKAEWDRRWKCEILLFYDWSSTRDTMTASKLTVLKKILIEWDISKSDDVHILILNGGYIEWLQTYPMMSINPDVIYHVQNDSLDELLNLESIEYPVARVLKPPSLQPAINRATKPGSATSSQSTISNSTIAPAKSSDSIMSGPSDLIIDLTGSDDDEEMPLNDPMDIFSHKDNRSGEDMSSQEKETPEPELADSATAILGSAENGSDDFGSQNGLKSDYALRLLQEAREQKKGLRKAVPKVNRAIKPSTRSLVVQRGFTGLKNLGATCYMNAILQVLLNTPKMYDYFMNDSLNTRNVGTIAKHFRKLFVNMWSGTFKCISPKDLRNVFTSRESRFIGTEHQDAQEFFYSFNTSLHEDLKVDIVRPVQPAWTPKEQSFIRDTNGKISIITDTFVGQYMARLQCEACQYTTINYENFQTVGLTLPDATENDLNDCVAFSERRSRIQNCKCGRCKSDKTPMLIAHKLYSIAPVIVFTALRFMVENNEYTKNDSIFTFPMESLQFQSNVIYDLYGIVIHRGNMNFGHYIAIVKNCLTGRWMKCDDDYVTEVDVKEVVKATDAYMLFYGEREDKSKPKK